MGEGGQGNAPLEREGARSRGAVTSGSQELERVRLYGADCRGAGRLEPRGVGAGRGAGGSYPEAAGLQATGGPGDRCNPLGRAGRCARRAPGPRSRGRRCVGSARLRGPKQACRAGRAVSAPAGSSAPLSPSGRVPPLGSAPARARVGSGGAAGARRWRGQVGRRVGAEVSAHPAIPQPATGAHLCRDKG